MTEANEEKSQTHKNDHKLEKYKNESCIKERKWIIRIQWK